MFGMLLAAGLAVGRWWIAVIAAAIFLAGTEIRIRREEQLLRETFGHAFEEYMRRVPAFVPKLL
jgi:protein-S-isoprenylcysteine O-methyltransferase Ste14